MTIGKIIGKAFRMISLHIIHNREHSV